MGTLKTVHMRSVMELKRCSFSVSRMPIACRSASRPVSFAGVLGGTYESVDSLSATGEAAAAGCTGGASTGRIVATCEQFKVPSLSTPALDVNALTWFAARTFTAWSGWAPLAWGREAQPPIVG